VQLVLGVVASLYFNPFVILLVISEFTLVSVVLRIYVDPRTFGDRGLVVESTREEH